ncbi:hypothetical protein [Phytomonospora endophytica]|uniref:Uncharacterized protein n=1 Tax=Phytomonospora endophytica TaxID=714109 RepID=A0A841FRS1_9ACTN|nr:hypothetical protein [Phytomonospora endophytica]MBB6037503.1 hypothetical protein [Phytomonospora endophytica]GIG70754.1 hypothetical protein Pen01_70490 [Phytomonospora endophytica]
MRSDDERAADLDLVVEGDGPGHESTEDAEPSRRALLLSRLARPWPRPLLVAVTAVVAIGGTAMLQRPDPEPVVPPVAEVTPNSEPPVYVIPGDGYSVVDDEFLIGEDGSWTADSPSGELLVEASGKLGTPRTDPVFFGSALGEGSGISDPLPAGEYVLEVACAASLDDVSMRLDVTGGADLDGSYDIRCDGPQDAIELTLTEETTVSVASVGPNAVHIGYSFRILPAER